MESAFPCHVFTPNSLPKCGRVESAGACLKDNRGLSSQRTTGHCFEFPLGKASSVCPLPLTGHLVRLIWSVEGWLNLSYMVTHEYFPYFFFQTVNIPSTNAVYPKTFLAVSKRTQEPKGAARLVTPIALSYCMPCPRLHVHQQIPGQEGALGALSSPFSAPRTTLKPSCSSINPFSISLVPTTCQALC